MFKLFAISALALSFSVVPVLAQGSQNVRNVQQALKDKGYDPGPVDGIYGPHTRDALRQYQEHEHLTASGRINSETMSSLGVQPTPTEEFNKAATTSRDYSRGGKDMVEGGKALGKDTAHGYVGAGAETFGKDVAHGAKDIGKGTVDAAKDVGKGVKDSITEKPKHQPDTTKH
jgi:peptidoglycan hydrolase-like protein with peptidoglycan-binding domain